MASERARADVVQARRESLAFDLLLRSRLLQIEA
jgi:hypothetical protein